jgi:hypothetical protein
VNNETASERCEICETTRMYSCQQMAIGQGASVLASLEQMAKEALQVGLDESLGPCQKPASSFSEQTELQLKTCEQPQSRVVPATPVHVVDPYIPEV